MRDDLEVDEKVRVDDRGEKDGVKRTSHKRCEFPELPLCKGVVCATAD